MQQCGKCFSRLFTQKNHEIVDTGQQPHECNQCGKCFGYLLTLRTRTLIHTGEKSYERKECRRGFTGATVLRKHVRIHTGEGLFECTEHCGKPFCQVASQRRNERLHSEEKKREVSMRRYEHSRTGKQPHACKQCDKRFN